MRLWAQSHLCQKQQRVSSILAVAFALMILILGSSQSANAILPSPESTACVARRVMKAGRCSTYFGQKFKDNGYQLMNDRDAPIWQNPGYWPVTLRITPFWSRESTVNAVVAVVAPPTGRLRSPTGFNLSGLDILTGGTLEKNITFLLVPSSDETGAFHFESANVRFDNLSSQPVAERENGQV
jgi:hypothetical protein